MAEKSTPWFRKFPLAVGLVLMGLVAAGLAEGAARILAVSGIMGFTSEAGAIVPHGDLGWSLSPSFSGEMSGVQVTSSPEGLRVSEEEHEPLSAKAPVVIWLLGDSFVFGWGLSWADTLGAQLQKLLPVGSVVHNLGVPGYGLSQSLIRLRELSAQLPSPDAVFLVGNPLDYVEDLQPSTLIFTRPSVSCAVGEKESCDGQVPGELHWFLWSQSTAYRNLRFFLEQRRDPPVVKAKEKAEGNLVISHFRKAVESKGAVLFPVLHVPDRWSVGSGNSARVLRNDWVDITRSLHQMLAGGASVQRDGVHWTADATSKVAALLRAILGKDLQNLRDPPGCAEASAGQGDWVCSRSDRGWVRKKKLKGSVPDMEVSQVYIPAGAGLMGPTEADLKSATDSIQSVYGPKATREYFLNETPAQVVYLDGFWIDKTEVTHGAFSWSHPPGVETLAERRGYTVAYRGRGEFEQLQGTSWRKPGWPDIRVTAMANLPVTGVTWVEALKHCEALGLSLPTEAQWERAARSMDGRRYPWGEEKPSCGRANAGYFPKSQYCGKRPKAVGTNPRGQSVYGVQDVAGNVFEWVKDCRTDGYFWMSEGETWLGFPSNPTPPPAAYVDDCKSRVMRGGSWAFGYDAYLRPAARAVEDGATMAEWSLGFRCGAEL